MKLIVQCLTIWVGLSGSSTLNHSSPIFKNMYDSRPILPKVSAVSGNVSVAQKILKEMSWGLRVAILKDYTTPRAKTRDREGWGRRVNVQALQYSAEKKDDEDLDKNKDDVKAEEEAENEDNNMKMKLFRLMYETVRDCDLKVKRAELIKRAYANSSSFEIGYLLGDITDKYNIMNDIALTLKKLHREWKPIEHINAYEQIANLGLDMGHLIDLIKAVDKRTDGGGDGGNGDGESGHGRYGGGGRQGLMFQDELQQPDPDDADSLDVPTEETAGLQL